MKAIMASLLLSLSFSASATTYFNCKITELDEVGSPISIGVERTVSIPDSNPKTSVIGSSNGREYQLSFTNLEGFKEISPVNICVTYSSNRCLTLASAKNMPATFLYVKDMGNNASVECRRL